MSTENLRVFNIVGTSNTIPARGLKGSPIISKRAAIVGGPHWIGTVISRYVTCTQAEAFSQMGALAQQHNSDDFEMIDFTTHKVTKFHRIAEPMALAA